MTRVTPATIRVMPNMPCVMALTIKSCGCAVKAQPVMKRIKPGMKFLFGLPSRSELSHTPMRPADHQMIPMVVCCQSFRTQGVPQWCSVKVLTQPQAAMTELS